MMVTSPGRFSTATWLHPQRTQWYSTLDTLRSPRGADLAVAEETGAADDEDADDLRPGLEVEGVAHDLRDGLDAFAERGLAVRARVQEPGARDGLAAGEQEGYPGGGREAVEGDVTLAGRFHLFSVGPDEGRVGVRVGQVVFGERVLRGGRDGEVADDIGAVLVSFVPLALDYVAVGVGFSRVKRKRRDEVRAVLGDEHLRAVEGVDRPGRVEGEELADAVLTKLEVVVEVVLEVVAPHCHLGDDRADLMPS